MSAANYVFDAAQAGSELERLRALETIFDPATRQLLEHVGLASGWHCLEVGAGAGSIARWIGEIVGDRGRAVALDTDPKFLGDGASTGLEVRQADISTAPPERACFDLAHARYVLIHVAARERALQNLLDALRPGGWLVLEEPDFSAARSVPAEDKQASAFAAINRAIERMFAGLNLDRATGLQLPALLQRNGLRSMAVETDAPLVAGNSAVAQLMKMSAANLRDRYLATGEVTEVELAQYHRLLADPQAWAVHYATVRVVGQKA